MIPGQLAQWRQAVEAVDLSADDSRQRLNQLYTEIVTQLREEFQSTTFAHAASSIDQKRAAEAADPSTEIKRLWKLITHYPGEVVNNPIWELLQLSGGLHEIFKDIEQEQLFPFAQVESFWQEVNRCYNENIYKRISLSYTALLPLEKHPCCSRDVGHELDLYRSEKVLDATRLSFLEERINDMFIYDDIEDIVGYDEGSLQQISSSPNYYLDSAEFPLPGGLESQIANDLVHALAPVFVEGDDLYQLTFRSGHDGIFRDAQPISGMSLSMLATTEVSGCIRFYSEVPPLSIEFYQHLAKYGDANDKSSLAFCIHTPTEILEELSNSTSKKIIDCLARNPMTPVPVLHRLMNRSGSGAKTVQRYVKNNPAYASGEVWQLIEMKRLWLNTDQRKKNVLLACLDLFASETNPMDSLRLMLNAWIWAQPLQEPSVLRFQMIQKGWASEELMLAAAWSWNWLERLAVANSSLAPAKALTKLQGDGLAFIRHAALQQRCSKGSPK